MTSIKVIKEKKLIDHFKTPQVNNKKRVWLLLKKIILKTASKEQKTEQVLQYLQLLSFGILFHSALNLLVAFKCCFDFKAGAFQSYAAQYADLS